MNPLAGLRVWITRPLPTAERSADAWRAWGADAVAVPTVRLRPVPLDPEVLRRLREELSPAWKLVLTSANAAESLLRSLDDEPSLARILRRCPAHAVGPATASRARELGLRVVQVAPRAVGADLAAALLAAGEARGAVLLPGSDVRGLDVETALREAGAEVVACTVYRNEPIPRLPASAERDLVEDRVDLIAFYSPSGLRGFLAAAAVIVDDAAARCPVAVLGPTTREAARVAGCQVVAEPASPGEPALLEAVARWWAGRGPA